ncbi:MAG: ABC transporter permease [Bryobacterales bacterium]|nr:ABC transporter permease [Acidobacteriota bacterium]MCB9384569.1 ABC transporter permease [Bryobacterales bacterium]
MDEIEKKKRIPLVYRIVFENLRNRRARTVLSALAIGLSVTMMLAIKGLAEGMMADQRDRARGVGADLMVLPEGMSVIAMSSAPMSEKLVEFVQSQPHVKVATGITVQPLERINRITGIDFGPYDEMAHFRFIEGGPFQEPYDAIVDEFYARQRKLHVGDKIEIISKEWTVRGIVEPGKAARLLVQKDVLQELTGAAGKITAIYVQLDSPENTQTVMDDLREKMTNYQVYTTEELMSQFSVSNMPEVQAFINVIIALSVAFGFLVIFLTMHTAVLERTREIGILKSLGASADYVLGIFVREACVLGFLGAVVGIVASFATRELIAFFIPASMQQAVVPQWWPVAIVVTMLGALLGVLYPAVKAAKQDALESLSYD